MLITVPTVMSDLGWSYVDLMKIDIEGHEAVLLHENCDWLRSVGTILIECHDPFGEADLAEVATLHGFTKPQRWMGNWILRRPEPSAQASV